MKSICNLFKSIPKKIQYITSGVFIFFIILIVVILFINKGSGAVSYDIETSLKEVITTSEIKTIEYTYNSIAEAKDGEKTKYYVSYKGSVTASFDLDSVSIIPHGKDFIIAIPEINIDDPYVIPKSLKFIFTKSKYETETVSAEALKLCTSDLEAKVKSNETIIQFAEDSARTTLLTLAKPYKSQLSTDGDFIIAIGDEMGAYK